MRTLKEMVSNGQKVRFTRYLDGNLYYSTECDFEFPVPITDIGNATFLAEDKAMLFMRYIRKHLDLIARGLKASENAGACTDALPSGATGAPTGEEVGSAIL